MIQCYVFHTYKGLIQNVMLCAKSFVSFVVFHTYEGLILLPVRGNADRRNSALTVLMKLKIAIEYLLESTKKEEVGTFCQTSSFYFCYYICFLSHCVYCLKNAIFNSKYIPVSIAIRLG